jgi:hypothetical protein
MPQVPFSLVHTFFYFYGCLVISLICMLPIGHAAEFSCAAGNVTCLIASINEANGFPGDHDITLEAGTYTLQAQSSTGSGLPVITSSIRIRASVENPATVIARDPSAGSFRTFNVATGGRLHLIGITVLRSSSGFTLGGAILNFGHTTLENSSVLETLGEDGAIRNTGTLEVLNSVIADNFGGHNAGGIVNHGGNVLIENSTITNNTGIGSGGVASFGGNLVVKGSSVVSNHGDCCNVGGGIANVGGKAEIIASTIAKNVAGDGGGVWNGLGGLTTITNSTIRENGVRSDGFGGGTGGIANDLGTLRLQNTIVESNVGDSRSEGFRGAPDCSGNIENLGNNLIGDPSMCNINFQPSDLIGDPGLGALVGLGEDALAGRAYYPVLRGSPVINAGNGSACPAKDQLGNPRFGRCDIGAVEFHERMLVSIDVRPRSEANRINPSSKQTINVAVLSMRGFNATKLNISTIRFGATGTEATPIHVRQDDVNGDGRVDQILRFEIQDTGIECTDTSATLTAEIYKGPSIIGSSPITTTECKTPKKNLVSQRR